MSTPKLSLILVALHGWSDLVLALPGLKAATIAKDIELIIAGKPENFPEDIGERIEGLHSVKFVPTTEFVPRGAAVVRAIEHATAPFIGTHENHAYAEPETYEMIIEAMGPKTGCIAPVYYCLNNNADWAAATSVLTHGHAAAPADDVSRPLLVLHSGIYPADVLRPRAELFRNEVKLHETLFNEGFEVHFLPGTVNWHVEAGKPSMAYALAHLLGRMYGWNRSREYGLPEKVLRSLAFPAIAAISVKRYVLQLRRMEDLTHKRTRIIPHVASIGFVFALGEVHGYFTKRNPWPDWADLHEYELLERLVGPPPEREPLINAVEHYNDPFPEPLKLPAVAE